MVTQAEQYFLDQLATQLASPDEVVATGYFRSFIPDRGGKIGGVMAFADAARALGHFLALTQDKLLVVKTRAPAFSSPLLENKGLVIIPLSSIRRVTLATDSFRIDSDVETLALQLEVSNKAFPRQERLLDAFAARFNLSESVASIRAAQAAQAKKRWFKLGIVAAVVIAAVLLLVMYKASTG